MNQDRFKFRAWDTHCKRMRDEQDYVVDSDTGLPHWIHDNELIQGVAEQLVLMQCTGLKDTDGRLIYEGDLMSNNFNTDKEVIREVKWMNGSWIASRISGKSNLSETLLLGVFYNLNFKIVGNIYETKT